MSSERTPTRARIADVLVVVLTPGVSLTAWERSGLLEREWALYARLAPSYERILLVCDPGERDDVIRRELSARIGGGLRVVEWKDGLNWDSLTQSSVPADTTSVGVVVKTNQMEAGPRALAIVQLIRGVGRRAALVARGGYLWSLFMAREHGAESPQARNAGAIETALCGSADMVVGTTDEMTDSLAWRHHVESDRVRIVPNYVDVHEPTVDRVSRDPYTIMFAGRLVAQKRPDLLLRSVAVLPPSLRARVQIIGEGPMEGELRRLAEELHLAVSFESRVPHRDLMARLCTASIFTQVSAYEGHPKTVLEAMASGCAVLVTDTSGLGSVVQPGVTGLRVASDEVSIADGLARLLKDDSLRQRLGDAASSHVRRTYSLDRIVALELGAHRIAVENAATPRRGDDPAVRFDPGLTAASAGDAVSAWSRCLSGFTKRLSPKPRAVFLASLDEAVYEMQGRAAVEAEGGLHPKHRLMRYHDFFVERVSMGERVLDLGCGVGALACSIARRSRASVVGMDWSPENLAKAERAAAAPPSAAGVSWIRGDITAERAPGAFDVIVLSNVLEHLRDRTALLARYQGWYEPRRFLIRVPAFDREWRVPWKRELGVEWRLDPTHETEFTEDQLRAELGEGGLRITEIVRRWGELWCEAVAA